MIRISFHEKTQNCEPCTPTLAKTYQVLLDSLNLAKVTGKRLKVKDVLEKLGIQSPKCLTNRLDYLQERGYLTWHKQNDLVA